MAKDRPSNRLASATSPYLLQHAHNPVDWYPWSPEALELAKRQNKPILLSVGYSACHWCHVMAHESFDDEATAEVMNRLFVSIKVDREERPDLDKIYQTAHQLLAHRPGGWPLTVFLTPQRQIPVFAGTYFPKRAQRGMPAFVDVLEQVADYIARYEQELEQHNEAVLDALARISAAPPAAATLDERPLTAAREALEASFDPRYGGFGSAPKFPHPTEIEFLLRRYARSLPQGTADRRALHMACFTLRRMALGGLFDQVGGGFARYSVDALWMIPHFEKMLSDNGQLLALFADAWQATGDELYARVARETAGWLQREMQSPDGGYYASLDADSDGEEGRYYVWTREKLQQLLDPKDYALVALRFGLDEEPNFEGRWHLHVHMTFSELAKRLGTARGEIISRWDRIRGLLYQAREARVRPGRDDKILTSWNALAIKGMLRAGRMLNDPALIESATDALDFLRAKLWIDGRLFATYRNGRAAQPAYLDDHAFLLDGLIEMLQTRWRRIDLEWARALADLLLDRFEDREAGSFYFTADDHEPLIQRPRPFMDEATPSGNGVAAYSLLRLGRLLGEPRYLQAAERALKVGMAAMREVPQAHGSLLVALEQWLEPPALVMFRADEQALPAWRRVLSRGYHPSRLVVRIPADEDVVGKLPGAPHEAAALVCLGDRCLPVVHSPQELSERLDNRRATR